MQRMPPCHIEPPGPVRTSAGIVIGGAYLPPRMPAYAHCIEARRRSKPLRNLAMCLLAVALIGLAIVGR